MNSQFIVNYHGTKFKESHKLSNHKFEKYKTIIEPFGGSFGFSRYLWEVEGLKNKEYIICDSNVELINFYNFIKHHPAPDEFVTKYTDIMNRLYNDCSTGRDNTMIYEFACGDKLGGRKWIEDNITEPNMKWLVIQNTLNSIIKRVVHKKKLKFMDMIRSPNVSFINCKFEDMDFNHFNKRTTLVYLDPPYMFEENKWYKDNGDVCSLDNFYNKLLGLFPFRHCLFVHPRIYLLHRLLKKYTREEYEVRYGNTGNIRPHVVYYS